MNASNPGRLPDVLRSFVRLYCPATIVSECVCVCVCVDARYAPPSAAAALLATPHVLFNAWRSCNAFTNLFRVVHRLNDTDFVAILLDTLRAANGLVVIQEVRACVRASCVHCSARGGWSVDDVAA